MVRGVSIGASDSFPEKGIEMALRHAIVAAAVGLLVSGSVFAGSKDADDLAEDAIEKIEDVVDFSEEIVEARLEKAMLRLELLDQRGVKEEKLVKTVERSSRKMDRSLERGARKIARVADRAARKLERWDADEELIVAVQDAAAEAIELLMTGAQEIELELAKALSKAMDDDEDYRDDDEDDHKDDEDLNDDDDRDDDDDHDDNDNDEDDNDDEDDDDSDDDEDDNDDD